MTIRRRIVVCVLSLVAVLPIPAVALAMSDMDHGGGGGSVPDSTDTSAAPTVSIVGLSFSPQDTEALVGDTVRWSNSSGTAHTVVSSTGGFASPVIQSGSMFSHRFARLGTYRYVCTIHPSMHGTVRVVGVTFDGPTTAVRRGRRLTLRGRAAGGRRPVTIERLPSGGAPAVAVATVSSDAAGAFRLSLRADLSGTFRARTSSAVSRSVSVSVVGRPRLALRSGRHRTVVTIGPVARGSQVFLQHYSRERFRWLRMPLRGRRVGARRRFVLPRQIRTVVRGIVIERGRLTGFTAPRRTWHGPRMHRPHERMGHGESGMAAVTAR